jgi:hypothetical protein
VAAATKPPVTIPAVPPQQVCGDRRRRDGERHAERGIETRGQEGLQPHAGRGLQREEREAQQDRGLHEQAEAAAHRVLRRIGAMRREVDALRPDHGQCHQRGDPHACERHAPAERAAEAEAHDRRERVAQVAADAVHRVRMAEAPRRDARVEDRVVGRVEDAVTEPDQRGEQEQPVRAGRERAEHRAGRGQHHAAEQHGPRAEAVDQESRRQLHHRARE